MGRRVIVLQDSLGIQTPAGIWPWPGSPEEEGSGPFGTAYFLRIPLPPEQPAVEDQQVSKAASPTDVILAIGYAMHPGLTPGSG
jgi:hypothetical protein